jgi:hypothetical protein
MRPAYYQVKAGSVLVDGQGTANVSNVDSIKVWGVGINGPATGGPNGPLPTDWATWDRSMVADTSHRKMWDNATHGDLTANDTLYTVQFAYTTANTKGVYFKFGIRGGDNESGFGLNHLENIDDSNPTYTLNTQWGSINPNFYSAWDYDLRRPKPLSVTDLPGIARVFTLEQNYPNPFNPSTNIKFSIPVQSSVELKVYNLLGQEVATLVNNETLKAGNHVVSFNASNLASGVYFYKITAGQFVSTKKLMLLK